MTNTEKLDEAVRLLSEIGCPKPILDGLWVFRMLVSADEIKLRNWGAWAEGNLVEGDSVPLGLPTGETEVK